MKSNFPNFVENALRAWKGLKSLHAAGVLSAKELAVVRASIAKAIVSECQGKVSVEQETKGGER